MHRKPFWKLPLVSGSSSFFSLYVENATNISWWCVLLENFSHSSAPSLTFTDITFLDYLILLICFKIVNSETSYFRCLFIAEPPVLALKPKNWFLSRKVISVIWGWVWNHIPNNLYSWYVLICELIFEFCQTKPYQTKPGWLKNLVLMWNDILNNFYLWYFIGLWVYSGVLPNQTIPNQTKSAENS